MATTSRKGFIVRIIRASIGDSAGVGFVVGDREIVTCAHVVNVALGLDKTATGRPSETGRVLIEFPLLGDAEGAPLRNCKVTAWSPPGQGGRDVAGLTIVGGDALPVGAGPARLMDLRNLHDAQVSVFGYPAAPARRRNGGWAVCRFRGAVGGGLVQLDAEGESALRAQPGYSGSPAIMEDEWGDAVVGMLAVAPREGTHADAYAVPVEHVANAWPELLGESAMPPCPYRGLQAFTAADAQEGVFVGREDEVARLNTMVQRHPLVLVVGPSGVGKSSLVAAGLEPTLRAGGWDVASFRPGRNPFDSAAHTLLNLEKSGEPHTLDDLNAIAARIHRDGLLAVTEQLSLLRDRPVALVCDQMEEIFTAEGGADLEFLQKILPSADDGPDRADVRLICTLRADFLPALLELPGMGLRLQDRQLNITPLDEHALARVIAEPSQVAKVTYSPGLVETIARESSRSRGGLPLLEFTLTKLWATQHRRRLTFDHYHALGGVAGALNRHAEEVYGELCERYGEKDIRRVLLAMVRARGGAASAARVVARRQHLGDGWKIAEDLAQSTTRLVVLAPEGPDTAEIAHEALIREWKRFGDWVEEDAEFQRWLAVMEERAADGDLLSEVRIAEGKRWLEARPADVPQGVVELIEHSEREISIRLAAQKELLRSNAELEDKAALLARQNRAIEIQNFQIEQARRTLEERAEQLALASRYKSEFMANMSHELRTPLNSLLVLAKLLADNPSGTLTSQQEEFARAIHGAGSGLLQLINDILDLSKVEAGRMDIHPQPIPLSDLVRYVETLFTPLVLEKDLTFTVEVDDLAPVALHADEQRLQQVLRNLLTNAVQFTVRGEVRLRIVPPPREVLFEDEKLRAADQVIGFQVCDTGIGIPTDKLEIIFEPFRQADGTTSRKYGGSGLGLSICREIARLLGGEIHVDSEHGVGSVFTLYLPVLWEGPLSAPDGGAVIRPRSASGDTWPYLASVPPPAAEPLDAMPIIGEEPPVRSSGDDDPLRGAKILIIDDDVRVVFALASVLERNGATVLYAENGDDGFTALERDDDVALLLIDLMMPDVDGWTAMAAIRRMPAYAKLPIIALNNLNVGREPYSVASDYVPKPVDITVLLNRIRHWLSHSTGR
ncbi:ATP-binding protein [Spongiactinospora sp. TRM90649]|uniref:nSTAND1 domain-containing NTPase n=1 Tax=Spongiactinospora sp. TRM90649 TaxID=3031114 RepID=UPI0023F7EADA|nr:ATP-binding protein [Spongiactinospora sp. TRM90649]MDF5753632.1 ATP-binding protein [Spongiactinospora sp. TRM90649]